MASNLQKFRRITKGFTRGCNFEIGIIASTTNSGNAGIANETSDFITAFATSTALPTRNFSLQSLTVQYGLLPINMPVSTSFTPWTITFLSDSGMCLRNLFLGWQEMVYNIRGSSFSPMKDYKVDTFWAAIFNENDNPVTVYRFIGVWPQEVGILTASQQDNNILQYTVTFAYDFFYFDDISTWELVKAKKLVK